MAQQFAPSERIGRVAATLESRNIDAFICALPRNVLMLSGYWPVVGNSLALVTSSGASALVVPEDEMMLARSAWVDEIVTFTPGSLDRLSGRDDARATALVEAAQRLHLERPRIGFEAGPSFMPAPYAAVQVLGSSVVSLLETISDAVLVPADETLDELASTLTELEIDRLRVACSIASSAFGRVRRALQPGVSERSVAGSLLAALADPAPGFPAERAGGHAFCMSGPNSAAAFAAFQRSTSRKLENFDLVLIHVNSYADGYWTDITRTYSMGPPNERARAMYDAVLAARDAAFATIKPGARGRDVDEAARRELHVRGFGAAFKHGTGHGVGFAAIDHEALPRIHPKSEDMLAPGMVFNVEPGIYQPGLGGLRHCDMVLVTERGSELLTPFHASLTDLIVGASSPVVTVWEDP